MAQDNLERPASLTKYTGSMTSTPPEKITVDDVTLTLSVERKRVKNVNARLRGSTLYISAPPQMPSKRVEQMSMELGRKLLRRERARQVNNEEDAFVLALKVARRFERQPRIDKALFVTNQRSRWGSYSQRTRTIRLNAALQKMPPWVLEAVVAHELAHVIHPDHSPEFWELLHSVYPESERAMAFLEGVGWLASNWEKMSPVEFVQLTGGQ